MQNERRAQQAEQQAEQRAQERLVSSLEVLRVVHTIKRRPSQVRRGEMHQIRPESDFLDIAAAGGSPRHLLPLPPLLLL